MSSLKPGCKVGRWTLREVVSTRRGEASWLCICDCSTEREVSAGNLRSGASKSCGCLNKEVLSARSKTHGLGKSPVYSLWNAMRQRCQNPNSAQWADYGGRGITICPEWEVFENFFRDMGHPPFPRAQLDRRDNSKGYSKFNCRWVTRKVNANNTRKNALVEVAGETLTVAQLAEKAGLKYSTLYQRLYRYKWPMERCLTERPRA